MKVKSKLIPVNGFKVLLDFPKDNPESTEWSPRVEDVIAFRVPANGLGGTVVLIREDGLEERDLRNDCVVRVFNSKQVYSPRELQRMVMERRRKTSTVDLSVKDSIRS